MLKCGICGCEFEATAEMHYISRDEGKTGLAAVSGGNETFEYDSFDCPRCGCQFVAQQRKRRVSTEDAGD